MPKIPLNLDPRVLSKLRAVANREGVSLDDAANRLLGNALRLPLSTDSSSVSARTRPAAQSYEYDNPDESNESDQSDQSDQSNQSDDVQTSRPSGHDRISDDPIDDESEQ
jgi:hypothetical protein